MSDLKGLAIVTGASSGIGLELAKCCAREGFDLLIAADEPEIEEAAAELRSEDTDVEAIRADLATQQGVEALYAAIGGRAVDALLANAGIGLGHAFLDQDYAKARRVIDTNIVGTTLAASSSPDRSPASCPAASKPSTTPASRFSTRSLSLCERS
jgi:short-subunit dehydrogenase